MWKKLCSQSSVAGISLKSVDTQENIPSNPVYNAYSPHPLYWNYFSLWLKRVNLTKKQIHLAGNGIKIMSYYKYFLDEYNLKTELVDWEWKQPPLKLKTLKTTTYLSQIYFQKLILKDIYLCQKKQTDTVFNVISESLVYNDTSNKTCKFNFMEQVINMVLSCLI